MHGLFPAPFAEFLELNFALHRFPVLARIIIAPLADRAAECDQIIGIFNLCHTRYGIINKQKKQLRERSMVIRETFI